jgi:hypothetical protein
MALKAISGIFCLFVAVFSASGASPDDLSSYHQFRIGSDVATVVASAQADASEVNVLHRRPALIQELEWRPNRPGSPSEFDAVRVVVFSFYNGKLFRIFVDYDRDKTEGLSADDLIQSISAKYGTPTRPVATVTTGSQPEYAYASTEAVLARWQDAEYALNLIRSSQQPSFGLIIASRSVDRVAQKAIVEGARLDLIAAPQVERDRVKKEADAERTKQDKAKLINKPAFKP